MARAGAVARDDAEERLAEASRLAAIVEATPHFAGIADPTGKVLYLNRAAGFLTGVEQAVHRGGPP